MSAIGGSIFGFAASGCIAALTNESLEKRIVAVLRDGINSPLVSDPTKLEPLLRTLYFYHVTDLDGKQCWRFERLEFGRSQPSGFLTTTTEVTAASRPRKLRHRVHVLAYGKRLILLKEPLQSGEAVSVAVFPDIGERFHRYDAGVIFKQTWDATDVVRPCLMSFEPLVTHARAGFVDQQYFEELETFWRKQFSKKAGDDFFRREA